MQNTKDSLQDTQDTLQDTQDELDSANSRIDSLKTQMLLGIVAVAVLAIALAGVLFMMMRRQKSGGASVPPK